MQKLQKLMHAIGVTLSDTVNTERKLGIQSRELVRLKYEHKESGRREEFLKREKTHLGEDVENLKGGLQRGEEELSQQ